MTGKLIIVSIVKLNYSRGKCPVQFNKCDFISLAGGGMKISRIEKKWYRFLFAFIR